MSTVPKFKVGDVVRVTKKDLPVTIGAVFVVKQVHAVKSDWGNHYYSGEGAGSGVWQKFLELVKAGDPDPDTELIARLDRIIELLEQQNARPVIVPRPTYPSYPSYPYWGPYWWSGTTSVGAMTGTTVINNSTGPTSSSKRLDFDG